MCKFWRNCWRLLAMVLCPLLVTHAVWAQQALNIEVVEGEGARNVVQQISARPITVRIEDAQGRPVAGARVVFTSPQLGPSGDFSNERRTLEVTTDSDGRASAGIYHPNETTGSYNIEVVAEFQNQTARTSIKQENVTKGKSRGKLFAILAIGGAAVAAVIVSSMKKSSPPTTPTTPPSITLGGTSVGAPPAQ